MGRIATILSEEGLLQVASSVQNGALVSLPPHTPITKMKASTGEFGRKTETRIRTTEVVRVLFGKPTMSIELPADTGQWAFNDKDAVRATPEDAMLWSNGRLWGFSRAYPADLAGAVKALSAVYKGASFSPPTPDETGFSFVAKFTNASYNFRIRSRQKPGILDFIEEA